eukprot:snap_masked-scaffold_5-processed-gene-15.31-mRNA-1 protein AED:1.00 eAED:1.00 QI:0/-1/0/0/-1/1/1/0/142
MKGILGEEMEKVKNIFGEMGLERLDCILQKFAKGFENEPSPTLISSSKPIQCLVKSKQTADKCTLRPMGVEKKTFLRKKSNQMLKQCIVISNSNPVISTQPIIILKPGPNKYCFVIDFKVLNRQTRLIDEMIMKVENHLTKV